MCLIFNAVYSVLITTAGVEGWTCFEWLQNDSAKIQHISGEKLDEELTVARLYISKLKSEVKNVVQRSSQLEAAQLEGTHKLDEMEKSLSDNRLLVQQVCITHV